MKAYQQKIYYYDQHVNFHSSKYSWNTWRHRFFFRLNLILIERQYTEMSDDCTVRNIQHAKQHKPKRCPLKLSCIQYCGYIQLMSFCCSPVDLEPPPPPRGILQGYIFLKAYTKCYKMSDVSTLAVGAFRIFGVKREEIMQKSLKIGNN